MVAASRAVPLLIFPFNGNGLEALDCLGSAYRLIGFVDDTPEKQGRTANGHMVLPRSAFDQWPEAQVLAVPGSPRSFQLRQTVIESLGIDYERFAQVIHPTARVSPLAAIGRNVLVMSGVVVTSNAAIGSHVCVLPNTVIHHDVSIGDWSLVGSNVTVAGNSHLGQNCYVGSGCSIKNGVRIGNRALVGIGSTVLRDVPAECRVAGNPARVLD